MATGAGKTFTAGTESYRLLKHGGFRRILFLVDRNNLGDQTLREFQNYATLDDGRRFTQLYNVDKLTSAGMVDSSYGVWRGVLEYFDAHIIGLTATPQRSRGNPACADGRE